MKRTCPYCNSETITRTRATVQRAGLVRLHCHDCQMGHDQAAADEQALVPDSAHADLQPAAESTSPSPSAAAAAETASNSASAPGIAEPPAGVLTSATPAPRKPRKRKK